MQKNVQKNKNSMILMAQMNKICPEMCAMKQKLLTNPGENVILCSENEQTVCLNKQRGAEL